MAARAEHPVFARFFHLLFSGPVQRQLAPVRSELVASLSGTVLEVGAGSGLSFQHYPPGVQELIAFEPEPYLRAKAVRASSDASFPITVRDGSAESLPLEDESVDAAVVSLVLCSVQDLSGALDELSRVLRPGGQLRFLEHVRSQGTGMQRLQLILDRSGIWPTLAGGCHCSRETVQAIQQASFAIEQSRIVALGPAWMPTNPVVIGRAHRR